MRSFSSLVRRIFQRTFPALRSSPWNVLTSRSGPCPAVVPALLRKREVWVQETRSLNAEASAELLTYSSTLPLNPDTLKQRHDPILPVDPIDPNETYYLGYVVQKEIEAALRTNPDDPAALASKQVLEREGTPAYVTTMHT